MISVHVLYLSTCLWGFGRWQIRDGKSVFGFVLLCFYTNENKKFTLSDPETYPPTKVIQKRGRMNGIVFRFIKNISANKRKYLWVVHNMAEQKCGNWWVDKKRFEKGQSGPGSSGQWGQIFIRCHKVRKVKLRPHIRLIRSLRNWNIVYDWVVAWGQFPCTRSPRTSHLW